MDLLAIKRTGPPDQAAAPSQLFKRGDYDTCARFASVTDTYDGRCEADAMWWAVCIVQCQLAESDFAPR